MKTSSKGVGGSGSSTASTPKVSRMRKRKSSAIILGSGEITSWTCRKCLQNKSIKEYYDTTDPFLDTSGKMSICSNCIDDMYQRFFLAEGLVDKAVLRVCEIINVLYYQPSVDSLNQFLEKEIERGKPVNRIFGIYIKILRGKESFKYQTGQDLTFQGYQIISGSSVGLDDFITAHEKEMLELAWGAGLTPDDYAHLEQLYARWTKTALIDNYAIEFLIRELCHKENELRKARIASQPTSTLIKEIQELMKNSALTPALQNAANTGKNYESFGSWIKDIENKEPAEWYEDQDKFKDIEGIDIYLQNYITRPIKNFVTGSRDFNAEQLLRIDDDDEDADD